MGLMKKTEFYFWGVIFYDVYKDLHIAGLGYCSVVLSFRFQIVAMS